MLDAITSNNVCIVATTTLLLHYYYDILTNFIGRVGG